MTSFKTWLDTLANGRTLSESEAEAAFDLMIEGEVAPSQMGGFLMALRVRGETVDEIVGAARSMRARAQTITAPVGAVDTCGTGGDGSGSFNISTAAAFVTAACGVPVAKHGNRNLSSRSGSADVLAALGVDIEAPFAAIEQAIAEIGIGFLMAPRHHAATRAVAPTRVELGTRTVFNLLGPLCNPAGVRRQVMGVYDAKWVEPLAEVLRRLGSTNCWVVHGDGMDELTTTGTSEVAAVADGQLTRFTVHPDDAGLPTASRADLAGGSPEENAAAMREVLAGKRGPLRDVVLLNAAAALIVGGKVATLREGAALGGEAIDSGTAARVLDRLASFRPVPA
ncbi:MAG TPA: anthranilate phosphoribosyltransferase [Stellaceae bacterium]|nr:anthranilate phosphoribosyltransferase [Stellaceae bacterium]